MLLRLVFLWGCLAIAACQPQVNFTLPGDGACTPPQALKDHLEKRPAPGCLVVVWEAQVGKTPAAFPIELGADGSLSFFTKDGVSDPNGDLALPPEAREKSLQFQIFVHAPDAPPDSFATHKQQCEAMGAAGFYCFAPGQPCWMSLIIQPQSDQSSHPVRPLSGATCRVCAREVCDGKDNNCNGKIDEFDEQNNRACPSP